MIDESEVSKYLSDNPDFFINKNELLMSLSVPHESGQAISLLERQVNLLREKGNERQETLNSFIANAKINDELFGKVRRLILEILKTSTLAELSPLIEKGLKNNFAASVSKLVFLDTDKNDSTISPLTSETVNQALNNFLTKKQTYCGPLNKKQAQALFPNAEEIISSAAIIPIQLNRSKEPSSIPLLLIGSSNKAQFHDNLDTLFLDFIGEILALHLDKIC